jgi:hypothetical protein
MQSERVVNHLHVGAVQMQNEGVELSMVISIHSLTKAHWQSCFHRVVVVVCLVGRLQHFSYGCCFEVF